MTINKGLEDGKSHSAQCFGILVAVDSAIKINLGDDGGTDNGGDDTSPEATLTITVTSVNDEPTFTAGLDQLVLEDAGPQFVANWATGIRPGPANESSQDKNQQNYQPEKY